MTRQDTTKHTTKAFTCSVCHVAFKKREHLSRHIRGHTDERPFQCPECKQAFTRNDVLQRHLRSHRGNARLGERKRRGPTTQIVTSLVNNNSILMGSDTSVSTSSIMAMSMQMPMQMPTTGIYTSLPANETTTTATTISATTNSNASSFDVANQFALSSPPGPPAHPGPASATSSLYPQSYSAQLYPYNNMHYPASNIGASGHYIANQFEIHPPSMSTLSASAVHPYPAASQNSNSTSSHEPQDMHLLDLMNPTTGSSASPSPYTYPSNSLYPEHR